MEWDLVRALAEASFDVFMTLPFGDVTTRRLLDVGGAMPDAADASRVANESVSSFRIA